MNSETIAYCNFYANYKTNNKYNSMNYRILTMKIYIELKAIKMERDIK